MVDSNGELNWASLISGCILAVVDGTAVVANVVVVDDGPLLVFPVPGRTVVADGDLAVVNVLTV